MTEGFDIGAQVRVKKSSPRHPGEKGRILKMSLGRAEAVSDLDTVPTTWVVQLESTQDEIPESDLELIAEFQA